MSTRIRVRIIGIGPEEERLKSLSDSLCLGQSVTFLGARNDVRDLLAGSHVIVHPAKNEAFGMALLEACAGGLLPIVFSDGGGALEVLPPDGLVVGDESDLARTLDDLVGSPLLGEEARRWRARWARERFPISATEAAYRRLYEMVVA
jgi:glycosyltransferase involved in cell wall biosynthesis